MSAPTVHYQHINADQAAADLATPLAAVIPGIGLDRRPEFLISAIGGLTKLEAAAIAIVGHLAVVGHLASSTEVHCDRSAIASEAVMLADLTLAACADLQAAHERVADPDSDPDRPDEAPAKAAEPRKNGRIVLP